ncbi:MAG: gfo/Idh/MocA family oxidoreductase, partial [Planctomycetota bacterium]|nr:gfo/Idh/MocA family oxidoreductase [Planctomycetota bacterium]
DLYPAGSEVTFEFAAKDKRGPFKLVWYDGSMTVPRPAELEPGRKFIEQMGFATGALVIGDRGKILYGSHGAGGCRIIPEAKMQAYKRPEPKIPRCKQGHHREWLDAIREGKQSCSPFDYGGRISEIGLLGVIAIRFTGQKLLYDEKAMRFTNCADANAFLSPPPFREGWKL